jgi:hypothetical protein
MCQNRAQLLAFALLPSGQRSACVSVRCDRNCRRRTRNRRQSRPRRQSEVGTRIRERAVLTKVCTKLTSATWLAASVAAVTVSVMTSMPAHAQGVIVGGCAGRWGAFSCVTRWGIAEDPYVRSVPQPLSEAEQARAMARDHKWLNRCKPSVAEDRYGVSRYIYAAPGCEFGVGEN